MVLVEFSYKNGKKKKKTFSSVKDCTKDNFENDIDQMRYFKSTKEEKETLICISDDILDWTIRGNIQDNHIFKVPNSYLMMEIYRCKNTASNQNCASDDEIDKWLYNKQIEPLSFNYRPDFKNFTRIIIPNLD